jgi:hypothetical protein
VKLLSNEVVVVPTPFLLALDELIRGMEQHRRGSQISKPCATDAAAQSNL